jgi:hypothetical protein
MPRPVNPFSAIGVSMTRLLAELGEHALGDLVGAVVVGDLLTHEEDALVAPHLLDHGAPKRLAKLELGHSVTPRRCSRRGGRDRGSGEASAKS